jgi:hypothetical protein
LGERDGGREKIRWRYGWGEEGGWLGSEWMVTAVRRSGVTNHLSVAIAISKSRTTSRPTSPTRNWFEHSMIQDRIRSCSTIKPPTPFRPRASDFPHQTAKSHDHDHDRLVAKLEERLDTQLEELKHGFAFSTSTESCFYKVRLGKAHALEENSPLIYHGRGQRLESNRV